MSEKMEAMKQQYKDMAKYQKKRSILFHGKENAAKANKEVVDYIKEQMKVQRDFGTHGFDDAEFFVKRVAVEKIEKCIKGGNSYNVSQFVLFTNGVDLLQSRDVQSSSDSPHVRD